MVFIDDSVYEGNFKILFGIVLPLQFYILFISILSITAASGLNGDVCKLFVVLFCTVHVWPRI